MRSRVGLLHPGQMGAAIATRLDTEVLWCPDGRSAGTRERADQAGLHSASITDLAECDVILSVVDPAAAEDVAAALMTAGFRDGLYIDANAIRPDRAQTLADDVGKVGADMIDACIVGPPPRDGARTRMFLSGPPDSRHRAAELLGTAVEITELDDVPGRASALKLSHTVAQKATRTLGALAHAMATQHGVDDHLTSLAAAAPHPAATRNSSPASRRAHGAGTPNWTTPRGPSPTPACQAKPWTTSPTSCACGRRSRTIPLPTWTRCSAS